MKANALANESDEERREGRTIARTGRTRATVARARVEQNASGCDAGGFGAAASGGGGEFHLLTNAAIDVRDATVSDGELLGFMSY